MAKSKNSIVFAGVSNEFTFEKGHVENRRVVIDELEQIHFEDKTVFEFGLSTQEFLLGKPVSDSLIHTVKHENAAQIDEGCSGGSNDYGV